MNPTPTPTPTWPGCPEDGLVLATFAGCGPSVDDQALTPTPDGPWLLGVGSFDPASGWSEYQAVGPVLPDTAARPPVGIDLTWTLVAVLLIAALVRDRVTR